MAYLKLVFDELEIAHLSEDGQYLCANKGVPQYRTDYLDFVCTDQEGKLIRPNFVTEHFDWLLRKYSLPASASTICAHLRHSCPVLRCGCQDTGWHSGPHEGQLHAGHLYTHHRRYAEACR